MFDSRTKCYADNYRYSRTDASDVPRQCEKRPESAPAGTRPDEHELYQVDVVFQFMRDDRKR
jgi:hypothetical protein